MILAQESMYKIYIKSVSFQMDSLKFFKRSFGVILALLSKDRKRAVPSSTGIVSVQSFITSLVIVPHRDLAYQFHHWIDRLVSASAALGNTPPPLSAIAQVVVRGGDTPISSQKAAILAEPPHILIGTPQALLELFDESFSDVQLQSISSVYVDEVDYLIDAVPRTRHEARLKKRLNGRWKDILVLQLKSWI
jgi:superfamily II DNA/RNA helicase